jgi:hypothetical protein
MTLGCVERIRTLLFTVGIIVVLVLASPNMTLEHIFFRENPCPVICCWHHRGLKHVPPIYV